MKTAAIVAAIVFPGTACRHRSTSLGAPDLPALDVPSNIVAIAAGVSISGEAPLSGLFFADQKGWVHFRSSIEGGTSWLKEDRLHHFADPRGLAFSDPLLYVYDQNARRIWTYNVREPDVPPRAFNAQINAPTHLAVSPHGLLAIIDGGRLVFLQEGMAPVHHMLRSFAEPAGLKFSAWDTLHVLDRDRRSLVTITFNRTNDGKIEFLSESVLEVPEPKSHWQDMTVFEGNIYLADEFQVFAYLESDKLQVPLLPLRGAHGRISQLAVNREFIYMLDHDEVYRMPRPEVVDLVLEGSPEASQNALLALYWYLMDREMLRGVRRISARSDHEYERLDHLLVREGVLIAPVLDQPPAVIRFYEETPMQRESGSPEPVQKRREDDSRGWEELLCSLNPASCEAGLSLLSNVERGRKLMVPDLHLTRRLSRERIVLEGQRLQWYLDRLVFEPEFQRRSKDPELIRRLNPDREGLSAHEILNLTSGSVVVPAEKWSVTTAVPGPDFADRESQLWALVQGHDGASLYTRAAYVEQAARSMRLQLPGDDSQRRAAVANDRTAGHESCASLREQHDKWLQKIKYPPLMWPAIRYLDVQVGILESNTTLGKTHQIFNLEPNHPTWFTARNLVLSADPVQATAGLGGQMVEGTATFSGQRHHGTHVSALIAGRSGECWSGLIPRAKLVLVDVDDNHIIQQGILDAISSYTQVFNISYKFPGRQEALFDTIRGNKSVLFVAAAGNDSTNLDKEDIREVPALAAWGAESNVIIVAAGSSCGSILPLIQVGQGFRPGSNYGKKYVDLVAPGEDIVSASEPPGQYGPATGTSQACPQVAAAAAVLVGRWQTDLGDSRFQSQELAPGDAKARLIATADWSPEYKDRVWGGMLNLGAAVMFPDQNHLRTVTNPHEFHTISYCNDPAIVIRAAHYYERSGEGRAVPGKEIPFSRILSLKKQPDDKYRIVFKEPVPDKPLDFYLKILLDAEIEDGRDSAGDNIRIRCSTFKTFDVQKESFVDDANYADGMSVTQIQEYVKGGHYRIFWKDQLEP